MATTSTASESGPRLVSILKQGSYLIASIHTALSDSELLRFQADVVAQIGELRSRGVIIDVAALDVMDSFGTRAICNLARMAKLRGAETVIVGVHPEVAIAIVQLGLELDNVHTALGLEEGLTYLDGRVGRPHGRP